MPCITSVGKIAKGRKLDELKKELDRRGIEAKYTLDGYGNVTVAVPPAERFRARRLLYDIKKGYSPGYKPPIDEMPKWYRESLKDERKFPEKKMKVV